MFAIRTFLALALASVALANPLEVRQATNTNAAINTVIDQLDSLVRNQVFTIETLQANHTATDGTVGAQVNQLITGFNDASTALGNIAVSSGSTTVAPTNDDISITFGDAMQQLSTGLSGLTTATVPTFTSMITQLDPAVAATVNALNTTLPGSLAFVHTLMLDAQQFLVREGAWPETLAALGF